MNQHPPNGAENEQEINPPHPPIDFAGEIRAALRGSVVHVNFAKRELLIGARVTLSAGFDEMRPINRRGRVRGRQYFVITMATSTIRGQSGSVLRRKAVIAVEE